MTAELLTQFLADRDAACPHCGYNLRGLREAECPECASPVSLTVEAGYEARLAGLAVWALILAAIWSTLVGFRHITSAYFFLNQMPSTRLWMMSIAQASGAVAFIVAAVVGILAHRRTAARRQRGRIVRYAVTLWLIQSTVFVSSIVISSIVAGILSWLP
jgi:hypothetical protein